MNAKTIAWYLAVRQRSPFHARKHIAVVPNVSWGLLPWEADLIVCSKAGYLTEVEIKISMSDWKADLLKAKHRASWPELAMIKRFYYAAPPELASRYDELALDSKIGVIAVAESGITVLREARDRPGFRKLTEKEIMKILRLAAIKAWRLAYDPNEEGFTDVKETDCGGSGEK